MRTFAVRSRFVGAVKQVVLDAIVVPGTTTLTITDQSSASVALVSWVWVLKKAGVTVDTKTTQDCQFTGLNPGSDYTLEETVTDEFGDLHFRQYTGIVINPGVLATPTVSAGSPTSLTIPLTFSDLADPDLVAVRRLYYTDDGATPTTSSTFLVFSQDESSTNFVANAVGTWKFALQDIAEIGSATDSALSSVATSVISSGGTAPDAVTSLTATAVNSFRIDLGWTNPTNNGQKGIYRVTGTNTSFTPDATNLLQGELSQSAVAFTDNTCAPDTDYSYKVETINTAGQAFSSGVTEDTPVQGAWPELLLPASYNIITWNKGDITTMGRSDLGQGNPSYGSVTYQPGWLTGTRPLDGAKRIEVVTDVASKYGTVMRKRYDPSDDSGNVTPHPNGLGWGNALFLHTWPANWSVGIYYRIVFRLSDDFQNNSDGTMKWFFINYNGITKTTMPFVLNLHNANAPYKVGIDADIAPRNNCGNGTRGLEAANANVISKGVYHTIEWQMLSQSAPGAYDGDARVAVNGIELDSFTYPGSGWAAWKAIYGSGAQTLHNIDWFPTCDTGVLFQNLRGFGFLGGNGYLPVPATGMHIDFAEIFYAGIVVPLMAVAFDAQTPIAEGTGTLSTTHTPVGTPRGLLIFIVVSTSAVTPTDEITAVTYGGTTITRLQRTTLSSSLDGEVYSYFLGSSIPTGAQTVSITVTAAASPKRAYIMTMTAGADTEVVNHNSITSTAFLNPSGTLTISGRTCFVSMGFLAGPPLVSGITPLTNWTGRNEHDFGSETGGLYTYDIVSTADVTYGWTQASDVAVAQAVGVSEVTGGGSSIVVKASYYAMMR